MSAYRQDLCLPGIKRSNNFIVIGYGIYRLLVYFLNHVAFLELRNPCVLIDAGYDSSPNAVWKIKLAGELRRQFSHMNSGEATTRFILFFLRLLRRCPLGHGAAGLIPCW